jgi:hypothetical protein
MRTGLLSNNHQAFIISLFLILLWDERAKEGDGFLHAARSDCLIYGKEEANCHPSVYL